jgi:hypothetical protein
VRITDALIPAEGGPTWGAAYVFKDRDVPADVPLFYKLEDIDYYGNSTFHGPVPAKAAAQPSVNPEQGPAALSYPQMHQRDNRSYPFD